MTTKHTPGPLFCTNGGMACDCEIHANGEADRKEANARLIAAAPDLLDSLERLLHELANGPATSTALREAHIAVARAKGET